MSEKITNEVNLFQLANRNDASESEKLSVEQYSYWKTVFRQFFKSKIVYVALAVLLLLIGYAIFVPIFSSGRIVPVLGDKASEYNLPSLKALFGTDKLGRDMFTMIAIGLRTSIIIALSVAAINLFFGIIVGSIWGYFRRIDFLMNELYNLVSNVPSMLKYFVIIAVFGGLGFSAVTSVIIGMTVTGWMPIAMAIRNRIIIYNNREFNVASRTLGSSAKTIIIYNLLPQILTVIITSTALAIPGYVAAEVGLSYFGIGLGTNDISLGRLLKDSYTDIFTYPHLIIFPAAVLGFFTITFYLIGLALSDSIDPRNHR